MKQATKIFAILLLTLTFLSLLTFFFMVLKTNIKDLENNNEQYKYLLAFIILLFLFLFFSITFIFIKKIQYKLFMVWMNIICIIGFIYFLIPTLTINITKNSLFTFKLDTRLAQINLSWPILSLYYVLIFITLILMFLISLKYRRLIKKTQSRKIISEKVKTEKVTNLNSLKKDAMELKNSLNSSFNNFDDSSYKSVDNNLDVKEKVEIVQTINNNANQNQKVNLQEEKTNSVSSYKNLLDEIKKHRDEIRLNNYENTKNIYNNSTQSINDVNNNNIKPLTSTIVNNPMINEEINKMEVFIPNSDRYKNLDLYKLKEKIYYENVKRKTYNPEQLAELQKKYTSSVPIGDVDKIWEAIRLQKNSNSSNYKNNNGINNLMENNKNK